MSKKLLYISLGIAGLGIIANSKVRKVRKAIEQLQVKVAGVHDVKMNWKNGVISAAIDLVLTNTTTTAIWLKTAGAIKIKQIVFYNIATNKTIGTAETEVIGIVIASQGSERIDDIKIDVPVGKLIDNLNLFTSQKELLGVELTITIFGKPFVIR